MQDELLSILGASDPTSFQEHMLKLFDNCAALKFGRGNKAVVGMTSSEQETLDFRQPVPIEGAAEVWMTGVEAEMKDTLFQISKEGVFYYAKKPRDRWIADSLGMVTLTGSQIWWTWETEDTFQEVQSGNKHAMKNFLAKQNAQLAQLTSMVRTDLEAGTRKKVNQLIIVEVHAKDIIDTFVRDSIMDARCAARFRLQTWHGSIQMLKFMKQLSNCLHRCWQHTASQISCLMVSIQKKARCAGSLHGRRSSASTGRIRRTISASGSAQAHSSMGMSTWASMVG